MCDPISATIAGAAVLGTGASVYSANKAAKSQKAAMRQAEARAKIEDQRQEVALNRANQKSPDIASIMQKSALAAKAGIGSTMLTGPGGVDRSQLTLGRPSLLGS